jgi:hypothetical protein
LCAYVGCIGYILREGGRRHCEWEWGRGEERKGGRNCKNLAPAPAPAESAYAYAEHALRKQASLNARNISITQSGENTLIQRDYIYSSVHKKAPKTERELGVTPPSHLISSPSLPLPTHTHTHTLSLSLSLSLSVSQSKLQLQATPSISRIYTGNPSRKTGKQRKGKERKGKRGGGGVLKRSCSRQGKARQGKARQDKTRHQ